MNRKLIALNVAEKPSVAKTVVNILSKNDNVKLEPMSKYNPVYQFDYLIKEKEYTMIFTSIKGHLMNWEFPAEFKKWDLDTVATLYDSIIKFI